MNIVQWLSDYTLGYTQTTNARVMILFTDNDDRGVFKCHYIMTVVIDIFTHDFVQSCLGPQSSIDYLSLLLFLTHNLLLVVLSLFSTSTTFLLLSIFVSLTWGHNMGIESSHWSYAIPLSRSRDPDPDYSIVRLNPGYLWSCAGSIIYLQKDIPI